ncbi:hypothetical protein BAUCODRAFT_374893 [Baudoinia panamericana UAMH 10762]|uniref:Uncharacterized protein n=1 Tax=Baudoinia panamericana (strain UAMH 10762) TaxID=717646 RepID=M2MPD2_BAUPA|nr:uncharacterized protein BAUCODRAFT_374893 [Baudoinia panamericana UAMH 10762]EMC98586.1 hypothetical protein BAUCODRAFT_374893 [Baudoinia panamericana UAMH 10762]
MRNDGKQIERRHLEAGWSFTLRSQYGARHRSWVSYLAYPQTATDVLNVAVEGGWVLSV